MYSTTTHKTNNEKTLERHWSSGDLQVTSVPHWMQLVTNTDCNIRCPFCFAWNEITRPKNDHTDLSQQAVESLTEFIRRGTSQVEMYGGGEILLSNAFWHFLSQFDRAGLKSFGILTNFVAPLRDPQLLAQKLDYIKISVAGATGPVYEKLMRGGKWPTLMENIQTVQTAGISSIWFIYILQQSNKHQIADILELCDRLGIEQIIFKQLIPTVNQDWYENEHVNHEIGDLADEINDHIGKTSVKIWSDLDHGGTGQLVLTDSVAEAVNRNYVCRSPWTSLNSHLDGKVHPCCFNLQTSYGNINMDTMSEIWNGKAIRQFRQDLIDLKYLQRGCPADCPDLAVQLQNDGDRKVIESQAFSTEPDSTETKTGP